MNTDKSGEGRILSLSTLGEPMSEEEFEDKMNTYELDQQYAEYIMEHRTVGNGEMLIRLMERGELYEDFKEHIMWGGK
tara:strand:+ start:431 stop:664 length:234 start_codon:yes stop_codon:yes gene_type:complete